MTVPRARAPGTGIVAHESHLAADEILERKLIAVTSVPRTLLDLAGVAPPAEIARAFREAEAKRLLTVAALAATVARHRGQRGNARLRAVLANAGFGTGRTRSELEAKFTVFLRRHGLPSPARNVLLRIGALEVEADCVWAEQKVIVELDGRAFHDTGTAFERDRERDRALAAHGWTVVRVTWRHLHRDGVQLARDLRAILRRTPG